MSSLPVATMVPLWFVPSLGWATIAHFHPAISAHLIAQAAVLVLGALVALALEFNTEASAEYVFDEGERLLQVGYMRAAADKFERALVLNGDSPEVRRNLAECYTAIGPRTRSERYWVKAIEGFLKKDQSAEAVRAYTRFRYLLPRAAVSPTLELQMASLLRTFEWDEDALMALERAQERAKGSDAQAALIQAAEAYCGMGKPERAMVLLERARSRFPDSDLGGTIAHNMRRAERMIAGRA